QGTEIQLHSHAMLRAPIFACPACGADCYRLYLVADAWACRKCHRLDYACRHQNRSTPGYARILYLRRRIAASPELFSPIIPRKHGRVRSQKLAEEIAQEIRKLEARLINYLRVDINDVLERRIKTRKLRK